MPRLHIITQTLSAKMMRLLHSISHGILAVVLTLVVAGTLTLTPVAEAKTINIGGMTLNITSNVSAVPQQILIDKALATGKIISLIKIIRAVERTHGGSVLDAGLYSPNPKSTATWYYYIKHRSTSGRIKARYYSASTGKELS